MDPTSANISPSAHVSPTALVGQPFRPLLSGLLPSYGPTALGDDVFIGEFAIVGLGTIVGESSIVDDFCKIEHNVVIGRRCLIQYRAYVSAHSSIGHDSIIGGFIAERSEIGAYCRVFGNVIHKHKDPNSGWDDDNAREESPVLQDRVFVGFGASVIGSIAVGEGSYIAAGALVTRDVPPYTRVLNVNQHEPLESPRSRE